MADRSGFAFMGMRRTSSSPSIFAEKAMDSVLGVVEIGRAKSTRRWFLGGGGHRLQPATANSRLFLEKRWNYQDQ
jgi:hypothetical protein